MRCGAAASAEHVLMLHGASPTPNHCQAARVWSAVSVRRRASLIRRYAPPLPMGKDLAAGMCVGAAGIGHCAGNDVGALDARASTHPRRDGWLVRRCRAGAAPPTWRAAVPSATTNRYNDRFGRACRRLAGRGRPRTSGRRREPARRIGHHPVMARFAQRQQGERAFLSHGASGQDRYPPGT